MPSFITINNLVKKYKNRIVLDIPHLSIEKGDLICLIGNNGAGKTTFFRCLLDLVLPEDGEIIINGCPVEKSDQWKKFTGAYLDDNFVIDYLTPEEYFYFAGQLCKMDKEDVDRVLGYFSNFFSDQVLGQHKYIRDFSKGNRQKIGIAASMVLDPSLLILDEPFANLDPTSRLVLQDMLLDYNKNRQTTILLSSHDINNALEISKRYLLLQEGSLIKDEKKSDHSIEALEEYFKKEYQKF